jgi:hypothetical protein
MDESTPMAFAAMGPAIATRQRLSARVRRSTLKLTSPGG